jgi:uncharacterized protein YndB with AHSA1/START domain
MSSSTAIPAVRRSITVRAPTDRAFHFFTPELGRWWPHESHHVGPMPAEAVLEPVVGGRLFSRATDGRESDWGRVLAWEPPSLLRFAWLLTPLWTFEPDPARASEVEVRFADLGDGSTRVELEHRGFERYAEGGETMRESVGSEGGWGVLLERFGEALS